MGTTYTDALNGAFDTLDRAVSAGLREVPASQLWSYVVAASALRRVRQTLLHPAASTPKATPVNPTFRARRTPEAAFERPILLALYSLGGSASTGTVLDHVHASLADQLTSTDTNHHVGHGEPVWRNTAKWARKRLVEKGLLRSDSRHGIWELSDAGVLYVETELA